ncbi:MAG: class I SAM-dependent methyltransferase [Crocinitomicaceae bacterium]|nr:class I SAM-dependent methyltransferase [Crocinitomicaceae bacterium]
MEFLPPEIDEYAKAMTSPESVFLRELNRETHLKILTPRMLSGHLQGRLLSMISKMLTPNLIVEVGTYTGYSAVCLAEGLSDRGKLITIDNNKELEPILKKYLLNSPKAAQIELHFGDAAKVIENIQGPVDLIFLDADKENYSLYFDLLIDKLRSGGIILADNVLWSGKVVQPVKENDRSTHALKAFNEKILHDGRVENLLLPVRDGIMMIRKK